MSDSIHDKTGSRRQFLAGSAAATLAALPASPVSAQSAGTAESAEITGQAHWAIKQAIAQPERCSASRHHCFCARLFRLVDTCVRPADPGASRVLDYGLVCTSRL